MPSFAAHYVHALAACTYRSAMHVQNYRWHTSQGVSTTGLEWPANYLRGILASSWTTVVDQIARFS